MHLFVLLNKLYLFIYVLLELSSQNTLDDIWRESGELMQT